MLYEFDHQQIKITTVVAPTTEAADEQLMALIQDGDEAALATLYRRHTPILRTVISRVVHNDADVDDLLQEAFVEVWKRAQTYDETKGKVLGWLITMARRRAIDRVRRRQAYARAEERLREQTDLEPESTQDHVAADANASDHAAILREMLATLPEAQREALHLAFYQGMSQREIAAKTGVPLGTIKTRLELGVRKVRAALLALGGVEEWSFCRG
jgi:RNA polymerase sigma-70 factor (ECF subfamily)